MTQGTFKFDGGAGTYIGTAIGATLLTIFTIGLALPWAMCMRQSWIAKHTTIDGRRLTFTGTGGGLFGQFIVWWFLTAITFGIYSFWVAPRYQKWKTENTAFA